MNADSKRRIRRIGWLFFFIYVILLGYFVLFSERYGRNFEYRYNLVLFQEIKRFFRYRHAMSMKAFILNMFGNVIGFMPFGFFVPIVSKKRNFFNVAMLTFEFSLLIELLQLLLRVGIFDVDDLLLNTLGGILGYLCYAIGYFCYRMVYRIGK